MISTEKSVTLSGFFGEIRRRNVYQVAADLLTKLSKIDDLQVISRRAVMPYRATESNARQSGKALGVGTILERSVRRGGNRVGVNVQLINAENDRTSGQKITIGS